MESRTNSEAPAASLPAWAPAVAAALTAVSDGDAAEEALLPVKYIKKYMNIILHIYIYSS